jgi:hypothetical protein
MLSVATVILVACAAIGGPANLLSGDTKNWITYRVDIGDQIVQFTIPLGISKDFLDPPIPRRIDLEQANIFDTTGSGPRLLFSSLGLSKKSVCPSRWNASCRYLAEEQRKASD